MKKKSKKILTISLISLLVLGILGVFYFAFPQNILGGTGIGTDLDYTTVKLIQENPQILTYQVNWVYFGSNPTQCTNNPTDELNLDFTTGYYKKDSLSVSYLPNNLIELPQTQKSKSVQLDNINLHKSPCGVAGGLNIIEQSVSADCTLSKGDTNQLGTQAQINCDIKANYKGDNAGIFFGDLSGSATVTFLKEGIECLDDSFCSTDEICQSNKCVISQITPTENITNPPKTLPSTDGGIPVEKTNYTIFYILLGVILLIIMFLFLKKKRGKK